MLDFAWDVLDAKRLVAAHAVGNERSQAVIEKLRFCYLGVNPAGFYKKGRPVEEREYELVRMVTADAMIGAGE